MRLKVAIGLAIFLGLSVPGLGLAQSYVLPGGVTNATDRAHCKALEKQWEGPIRQMEQQMHAQHEICLKGSDCKNSGSGYRGHCTCAACETLHAGPVKVKKVRDDQLRSCEAQVQAFDRLRAAQRAETERQMREQAELKREREKAEADRVRAAQQKAEQVLRAEADAKRKDDAERAAFSSRSQGQYPSAGTAAPVNRPQPTTVVRPPPPAATPSPPAIVSGMVEAGRTVARVRDQANNVSNTARDVDNGSYFGRQQQRAREQFEREVQNRIIDGSSPPGLRGGSSYGRDAEVERSLRELREGTPNNPNPVINSIQTFNNRVIDSRTADIIGVNINNGRLVDTLNAEVNNTDVDSNSSSSSPSRGGGGYSGGYSSGSASPGSGGSSNGRPPVPGVGGGSSRETSSSPSRLPPAAPVGAPRPAPPQAEREAAERKRRAEANSRVPQPTAMSDLVALADNADRLQKPAPRTGSSDQADNYRAGDRPASSTQIPRAPASGAEVRDSSPASPPVADTTAARQSSELASLAALSDDANKKQKQAFRDAIDRASKCPDINCANAALREAAMLQSDLSDKNVLDESRAKANARTYRQATGR